MSAERTNRAEVPPPAIFATTHWSVVLTVREGNAAEARAALEKLCRTYWEPVYTYLRRGGQDHHTAKDLTQSFFLRLLERDDFSTVAKERGRFRSFLLASLKHFLINEKERSGAQKRGGGQALIPLDEVFEESGHAYEPADHISAEKLFDRRWAFALFDRVLDRLRDEYANSGREQQFDLFKGSLSADGTDQSHAEIADQLGMAHGSVKVVLHRMRRRYRELLRDEVAQTLPAGVDVDEELRDLISILRS